MRAIPHVHHLSPGGVLLRGIAILALGLAALLLITTPRATDAQAIEGNLVGTMPPQGAVGFMTWTGGTLASLEGAAPAPVTFWVSRDGSFFGYIAGAPAFVNGAFHALFPNGYVLGQTVIVSRTGANACPTGPCLVQHRQQPQHTVGGLIDCATARCVALTFDDGPAVHTPHILELLAARDMRATFFVEGRKVKERPEVLAAIARAGHEIGNHTYSHPDLTRLSSDQIRWQIAATSDVIEQVIGLRPQLFRPPFGAHDARVREVVGMPVILWSIDPKDFAVRDPAVIVARVAAQLRPGAIILLHDTVTATSQALPAILDLIEEHELITVTVTELFGGTIENRIYTHR